jgi:Ca2+-binding RTX toxin-like protein
VESSKVLRLSDFGRFNDTDGDNLELVKFTGLPSVGILESRVGSDWVEVSATGFEINFYDIMSGRLRYTAGSEATPDALDFLVSDGELWSTESHTLRVYVAENRELGSGDQTITDAGGATVVTVSLPETIRATGAVIGAGTDVVEQIKALSNEEIGTRAAQEEIAERIESFIPSQGSESVYALKLMPGDDYDGSGIGITGGENGGALVIDASELPRGTVLNLNDVEFAVIIGPVHLDGGDGRNIVVADGHSQYIMLGEDDDTLDGGAGDDTVGSAGGDDVIDGGSGNDLIFGGEGNDMLDGGDGEDIAEFQGDYADYLISFDRESETWTVLDERDASVEGHDGTDTVTGVEQFCFGDMSKTAEAHEAGVQVTHWKSGAAINGVSETMTDADSDRLTSAMTDEAGQASNGTLIQGHYSLEAGKDASADGSAIGIDDSLAALDLVLGHDASSPYQSLAADVDRDGTVGFRDTLGILKMALGRDDAPEPEWAIVPADTVNEPRDSDNVNWPDENIAVTLDQDTQIDLIGVLLGDVDGSWGRGE